MFQKSFSKIWILVVVVGILIGGFLAWQYYGKTLLIEKKETGEGKPVFPESEITGWKVYYNKTNHYQLKYPGELELKESPSGVVISDKENEIMIIIQPRKESFSSIKEYINKLEKEYEEQLKNKEMKISKEKIKIEGAEEGYKITFTDLRAQPPEILMELGAIFKTGRIFEIGLLAPTSKSQKLFDQILSTFKFKGR
jgi:hypothetical protein